MVGREREWTSIQTAYNSIGGEGLAASPGGHLIVIEGAPHSFHLQPKQRDLRPDVLMFFDKHLKPQP